MLKLIALWDVLKGKKVYLVVAGTIMASAAEWLGYDVLYTITQESAVDFIILALGVLAGRSTVGDLIEALKLSNGDLLTAVQSLLKKLPVKK